MMSATCADRWSPPGTPIRGFAPRWLTVCLGLALGLVGLGLAAVPLAAGERQILIKVAQYPRSLDFLCLDGADWALGGRTGKIAPGARGQITGVLTARALLRHHVVVADVPLAETGKLDALTQPWQAAGWPVHRLTLGQTFTGPDGMPLADNRRALAAIAVFDEPAPAQALVASLTAAGETATVYDEVVHLAQGLITLKVNGETLATGQELSLRLQGLIRLYRVEYAVGYPWHGFADRDYRGRLLVRWGAHDALDCILQQDLDRVLAGIVPSEISAKAETGALQAQAVAARGEIMASIGIRHAAEGFDTCSEQHCQVYNGETVHVASIAPKIEPTRGLVLVKPNGAVLNAVYSSNCGGHTEANHLVWTTTPEPILAGRWDAPAAPALDLSEEEQVGVFIRQPPAGCFCNDPTVEGGDKFRWTKTITGSDWKAIEDKLGLGRIKQVTDLARGFSGRIYQMTFIGEKGRTTVNKELTIRQLLGSLRSSCFIAEWQRDAAGFITGVELHGAGFGHGVGMCQTGAQALAKRGWTFDRILAHYYPGSLLKAWY
ncbi:MAG: Amidase enhancer [Candidatus Ozemobacter sibiricus]|jgi:SpoIID/LytB domain protein|uniref:Amidase enhancer n=1 Tax=Candidatus Ozemobacter sibiricus TaxID=2268124 RepID=A0A367ZSP2_9BACT|nr:MAG: Amidase enhancer [Candidatus Ozemobacter sibiricus]